MVTRPVRSGLAKLTLKPSTRPCPRQAGGALGGTGPGPPTVEGAAELPSPEIVCGHWTWRSGPAWSGKLRVLSACTPALCSPLNGVVAPGQWAADGGGGCRGRQIETMADDTGVGIRLLGGFEATVGGRLVPPAPGACVRPGHWSSCWSWPTGTGCTANRWWPCCGPIAIRRPGSTTCTRRCTWPAACSPPDPAFFSPFARRSCCCPTARCPGSTWRRSRPPAGVRARRVLPATTGRPASCTAATCCPRINSRPGPGPPGMHCVSAASVC